MQTSHSKVKVLINVVIVLAVLLALNFIASKWFFRLDLTSEKRHSLSSNSEQLLEDLSSDLYVKVYLHGELNVGFQKLSRATREMLEEFKSTAGRHLIYEFIDPNEGSANEKKAFLEELESYGFEAQTVFENAEDGRKIQSYVFPYAMVYFDERIIGLNLLENIPGYGGAENLNISMESLEYKFTDALRRLLIKEKPKVAFLEGHGELDELDVIEATDELSRYYQVDRGRLGTDPTILNDYKAVIIAKPSKAFSEKDKFILDQYLMNGGRLLYLIDAVNVTLDSLRKQPQTIGLYNDVNLDDQLFRYGIRVNPVLVEDIQAGRILMNARPQGQAQLVPVPWLYSPLLAASSAHPISRNIQLVRGDFTCTIDTVGSNLALNRQVLLRTSQYTKLNGTPVFVNMSDVNKQPQQAEFNASYQPVAIIQEGVFPSVFQNRPIPKEFDDLTIKVKQSSENTRMMVVADGDIIRNEVRFKDSNPRITPLGYDEGSQQIYGNKDFIVNAVNYLCDDDGWMHLRGRHLTLRLLDKAKLSQGTAFWKWLNVGLPILLVIAGSITFIYIRKRRFGK
ncbi:gliding motility-associated ABC transporter substrate-binding protein GldG [Carboxylicivirga sp. N1Y90]|uniref:gliding motility-associated ABC transporter substrate-binding protein GldG n=1 Tax=Carboxylicivirga fragile TaxID=3417571 RepID=UPI003D358592|nr:gliding motility-associated ABC transporter substrate-binding protein GldG [Marinilabiliaceae bacterium N1Y90]